MIGMGIASFAYWSTDFLAVQRVLAAKGLDAVRKTPLIGSFPRMLLPILTVVPGLAALRIMPVAVSHNYNMALPLMFLHFYPVGLLGVGMTALLASFMSGMAGNVTAFNTVWTYDLYQSYIAPGRNDRHYLLVGRVVTVAGVLISIAAAYAGRAFPSIFDYWVLVSTIFVAAPFATFLLGVFTRNVGGTAAFTGMLTGILATASHFALYRFGCLSYASDLLMDFYGGVYGFSLNMLVTLVVSWFENPPPRPKLEGLVYWDAPSPLLKPQPFY